MKKKRAASSPDTGLRREKIKLAKRRLAQGFYDSPVVQSLVIERLLSDPQFLKTE